MLQLDEKLRIEDRRLYGRVVEIVRAVVQQTRDLRKRPNRPLFELTSDKSINARVG